MKDLFQLMEDSLVGWATGSKDQTMQSGDGSTVDEAMVRQWGERWLRVFRRKFAVEEAWFLEAEKIKVEEPVVEVIDEVGNGTADENGDAEMEDSFGRD
jgi:nuclear cap-binding protein subunit 1